MPEHDPGASQPAPQPMMVPDLGASPQPPGYWQASDGNWYPPHLHPDNGPSAIPELKDAPDPAFASLDSIAVSAEPTRAPAPANPSSVPDMGDVKRAQEEDAIRRHNKLWLGIAGAAVLILAAVLGATHLSSNSGGSSQSPSNAFSDSVLSVTFPASGTITSSESLIPKYNYLHVGYMDAGPATFIAAYVAVPSPAGVPPDLAARYALVQTKYGNAKQADIVTVRSMSDIRSITLPSGLAALQISGPSQDISSNGAFPVHKASGHVLIIETTLGGNLVMVGEVTTGSTSQAAVQRMIQSLRPKVSVASWNQSSSPDNKVASAYSSAVAKMQNNLQQAAKRCATSKSGCHITYVP